MMPTSRKFDNDFNREKKLQLILALSEMRARGMDTPDDPFDEGKGNWRIDKDGYFIKNDGNRYRPSANQQGFVSSNSRFGLFYGSRGSGKSSAGVQKALKKIRAGLSGTIINPDFENMKYSTWPEVRQWIPWDLVTSTQRYRQREEWEPQKPFSLVFPATKCKVYIKGLKDPNSARGPNINWLWYDEAQRDRTGLGWKIAVASVRIGPDPQAWATATPAGDLHWLYEFFIARNIAQEVLDIFSDISDRPLVEAFYGTIDDNKANLDPEFYASLLAAYPTGYLRSQEVDGRFVHEGGVLGDPNWFAGKIIPFPPPIVRSRVRYWDLAATEKKMIPGRGKNDPDDTVGTLLSHDGDNFYVEDQVFGAWAWKKIKEMIILTAQADGQLVPIYVEQEPGAGGKNQVAEIASLEELSGYTVRAHRPEGDKVMRANIWFAEAAAGRIFLVVGRWNQLFLNQLGSFPSSYAHDDKIDSLSGARLVIAPIKKWSKIQFLHL